MKREQAFNEAIVHKGLKKAFSETLNKEGLVFNPQAVNGLDYFKKAEDPMEGSLIREAVYAGLSNDGLLGFSTGPFEFLGDEQGKPSANYGQYLSVWIKDKKSWKLAADFGIAHSKPAFLPQFTYEASLTFGLTKAELDFIAEEQQRNSIKVLSATDLLYDTALNNAKTENTYKEFLHSNIRLLRNNQQPILGKEKAMTFLNAIPPSFSFAYTPEHAFVAASRDYGYTSGRSGSGSYLRIWKKGDGGEWRILVDVEAN